MIDIPTYLTDTNMMGRRRGHKTRRGSGHGSFDPYDANTVKHTRLGVWDLYEQVDPGIIRLPGVSEVARRLEVLNDLPYVWRMLKDVASIKSCWLYFLIYCIVELLSSLLPAVTLWFVLGHNLPDNALTPITGFRDTICLLYVPFLFSSGSISSGALDPNRHRAQNRRQRAATLCFCWPPRLCLRWPCSPLLQIQRRVSTEHKDQEILLHSHL